MHITEVSSVVARDVKLRTLTSGIKQRVWLGKKKTARTLKNRSYWYEITINQGTKIIRSVIMYQSERETATGHDNLNTHTHTHYNLNHNIAYIRGDC